MPWKLCLRGCPYEPPRPDDPSRRLSDSSSSCKRCDPFDRTRYPGRMIASPETVLGTFEQALQDLSQGQLIQERQSPKALVAEQNHSEVHCCETTVVWQLADHRIQAADHPTPIPRVEI